MLNIIVGLCLLCLGIVGIVINWWAVVDFVRVIIPLALLIFGVLSVVSGVSVRNTVKR